MTNVGEKGELGKEEIMRCTRVPTAPAASAGSPVFGCLAAGGARYGGFRSTSVTSYSSYRTREKVVNMSKTIYLHMKLTKLTEANLSAASKALLLAPTTTTSLFVAINAL